MDKAVEFAWTEQDSSNTDPRMAVVKGAIMKQRGLALFLAACLMSTLLIGCGDSSEGRTPKDRAAENMLHVALPEDLDNSLDPHKTTSALTRAELFNVFEGLVKPTPNGDLVCAVADHYEISEDRKTYTFTLRDGILFHNGQLVTAEDVVWSIQRCTAPENPEIVSVEALSDIETIEAVDEKTVVITLREPSNTFLSYLTLPILPKDYTEQDSAPVGTGPFRYVSRQPRVEVVLEKNEAYWGTPAKLDKVVYQVIEDSDKLLERLESGAVDLCSHLTCDQAAQLPEGFHVEEGTRNLVVALYLNHGVQPLNDIRVRKALCMGVDKQGIIDQVFDGYGTPIGSSVYPAFGKYFDDSLTHYYPRDVAAAKALLAEAGYPNGLTLTMTVPGEPYLEMAEVLVPQLAEIGVTLQIQPVEWETWYEETYYERGFETTLVGVDAANMTAQALLERFVSDFRKNFINYHNAAYDGLFRRVLATYEDGEQTRLYQEMARNLTENAANVYLQDLPDLVAVRDGIDGVQFYPTNVMDLSNVHYEKEA